MARRLELLPLLLSFFSPLLPADVVQLRNGDRLSGQVEGLTDGRLQFTATYAGEVTIPWEEVSALYSEEPFQVILRTGEEVEGVLVSPAVGALAVDSRVMALEDVLAMQREEPPLPEPTFFEGWTAVADLGYSVSRGNRQLDHLALSFEPVRETPRSRLLFRLHSLYNVQDGLTSSELFRGQGRYDHYLGPQLFVFAIGKVERDAQEQLLLRTSEGGGFGWRFGTERGTLVSLFGGVTFLQENFETLEGKLEAEGLLGAEIQSRRFRPVVFTGRSQLLPIFTDDRYRLTLDASARIPIVGGLTLGVQFFNKYDSNPPVLGVKKNDVGLVSTVGFTF